MTTIERSITVTSSPERTFDYLSDVGNLPRYMDSMTSAERTGPEEVHVTAVVPDRGPEEGEAWFRTDPATRRVEWGSEGSSDYHGCAPGSSPGPPDGSAARDTLSAGAGRCAARPGSQPSAAPADAPWSRAAWH